MKTLLIIPLQLLFVLTAHAQPGQRLDLDTELASGGPKLSIEGVARDAINLFNNVRKDKGFAVSDRVRVSWACEAEEVAAALGEHAGLVSREILATEFAQADVPGDADAIELAGARLRYAITRED